MAFFIILTMLCFFAYRESVADDKLGGQTSLLKISPDKNQISLTNQIQKVRSSCGEMTANLPTWSLRPIIFDNYFIFIKRKDGI